MPHNRPVDNDQLPEPEWKQAGLGRVGYRADDVDAFVASVRRALEHEPPGMAPYEVADQRFAATRFGRGYDMRGVDDYLDRAQETLRARHGDAVASLEGREQPAPRHLPTWWIYLIALVLAAAIVTVAVLAI